MLVNFYLRSLKFIFWTMLTFDWLIGFEHAVLLCILSKTWWNDSGSASKLTMMPHSQHHLLYLFIYLFSWPTSDFAAIYLNFERQVNQRGYNNLKQTPQSEMLLLLLLLLTAITKLHDNKSHVSSRMKSSRVNRISQHLPSTGSVSYWQGKQPFWESESKEIHMKLTLEKWWMQVCMRI